MCWENKSQYGSAWKEVAPHILPLISDMFGFDWNVGVAGFNASRSAVIHVRCSDVPMIRHKRYHLPRASFWRFVVDAIRDIENVYIESCQDYHSFRAKKGEATCTGIIDSITTYLRSNMVGPNVRIHLPRCDSRGESLRIFQQSTVLIAPIPSSFSFVVGVSKKKNFISPLFVSEIEDPSNARELPAVVPWTMHPGLPLFHRDVESYFDFNYTQVIDDSSDAVIETHS